MPTILPYLSNCERNAFTIELKPHKLFQQYLGQLNPKTRTISSPKFPKVPQKQVKLPDNLKTFASILKDFPGATIQQLAKEAQLSERMIKKDLRALKEFGIIERVGSNRKGYWKFRV
jgi:predicted HTH transcriptional regulator